MDGSQMEREGIGHDGMLASEKSRIKVPDGRSAVV